MLSEEIVVKSLVCQSIFTSRVKLVESIHHTSKTIDQFCRTNAEGIRLYSMFVDEGFDSLDDTKLSQAIQELMSISQTNRLVGIISHVTGLDGKIGRKIVVTKDRTGGSRAEIILN